MLKSRFSFLVYLYSFFVIGIVSFCIYVFTQPPLLEKDPKNASIAISFLVLFLLLFFSYIIINFVFIIKIYDQTIFIKSLRSKKTIQNSDIASINLFARKSLFWLSYGVTPIAVEILLTDGKKIIIKDIFYSNYREIKKTLCESFGEKVKQLKRIKSSFTKQTILETDYEKVAGNPYLSLNGILFF